MKEEIFKKIYKITEDYLEKEYNEIKKENKLKKNLKDYYKPEIKYNVIKGADSKNIFERLVMSLNNRSQGKVTYIGEGKLDFKQNEIIRKALYDYDYEIINKECSNKYDKDNMEKNPLIKKLQEAGFAENKNLYKFAHGIVTASQLFLENNICKEMEEAYKYKNQRKKLIKKISSKVYNMGYALTCDFLKESGFDDLVKPDVHILDICGELIKKIYFKDAEYEVIPKEESCIKIIERIKEESKEKNLTCYKIDKMFWLIGSSDFYLEEDKIEKEYQKRKVVSKEEFYDYIDEKLIKIGE